MRVFHGQKFLVVLMGACAVLGFSATLLSADETDAANAQTISNSAVAERSVSYDDVATVSQETAVAPKSDAACETGANCATGSSCRCRSGNWVVGLEAVWLSPQRTSHAATYDIAVRGGSAIDSFSTGDCGTDGLYLTPRIWLGYQGECWGIMGRYWRMNESGNSWSPFTINNEVLSGAQANINSLFKAETADLEATRLFCWGQTRNVLSFGVRYAELRQNECLTVTDVVDGQGLYSGYAASGQHFSGVGPTVALTGLKPIGCGNASLFYSLRGSYLWDDNASSFAETSAEYYDGTDYGMGVNGAYGTGCNANMFIGEVQVGIQWNYTLQCFCADAFFRFALEYQYWDINNSPEAVSTTYAGNSVVRGTAVAASDPTSVNLIGFSLAAGFTW